MATFSLNLQRRVEPGLAASGKFDGTHACLAAATSAGNVLVHSPHREAASGPSGIGADVEARLTWNGELAELQIGRQVTALCTGRLGEDERDVLLVGTSTYVLAYQVEDNADLFYKELSDGAYCITVGKLGWLPNQVAVIGGSCSITVLDYQGEEVYWTVARDRVTAIALFDFNGDGDNDMMFGTSDFTIKIQKADAVLWEAVENAPIVVLLAIAEKQFAYATRLEGNGTLGVYDSGHILWRIKSKHKVISTRTFDLNGDGTMELLTGWSSGKVDARLCSSGQVIFKVQMNAPIASLAEADYRRTGRSDLIILTVAGEVRGYAMGTQIDTPEPGDLYRQLLQKKQALQMELRQRTVSESNYYLGSKLAISIASARGAVRLGLASGPGLFIYYAMVFAEGIFEGESMVAHPSKPQGELEIALRFPKNGPIDIHVKTCVGTLNSDLLMVLELTHQLPQFCMYEAIPRPYDVPEDFKEYGIVAEGGRGIEEFHKVLPDFEIIFEALFGVMWINGINLKFILTIVQEKQFQQLYEKVTKDWIEIKDPNELSLLISHTKTGRKLTIYPTVFLYVNTLIVLTAPMCAKRINDQNSLTNETSDRIFFMHVNYHIDHEKYYYFILFHSGTACVLLVAITTAIDTIFINCIQHVLGLFHIVNYRLQKTYVIGTSSSMNRFYTNQDISYDIVISAIKMHKKCIERVLIIQTAYNECFFFVFLFILYLLSTSSVNMVMSVNNSSNLIKYGVCWLTGVCYIFFINWPGQKLLNYSDDLYKSIYSSAWYQLPKKTNNLLRIMMLRSIMPCRLTVGSLMEMNFRSSLLIAERAQRVALWLNQCLVLSNEIQVMEIGPEAGSLEIWLRGLRDQKLHCLEVDNSGKLTLRTEDPVFAGDMIQSLTIYLGLRELSSEAKFPQEEKRMLDALEKFKGYKEAEARLQAETAGNVSLVKNLVLRLEDARILEDIEGMRLRVTQLKTVNSDLIRDHEIRCKSYGDLVAALRELNVGVQNASRLRVGKAATNAVQRCRAAIKEENGKALVAALRHG